MIGTQSLDEFRELRLELLSFLLRGIGTPLTEGEFNSLALRMFRFQTSANPAYGGFVRRRGVEPEAVERWEDVPFLPTGAFKSLPLVIGDPSEVDRVFRTSGTTRGTGARGEHYVRDLTLYRESLIPNFQAHLLPDGEAIPALCLLASPEEVTDSSLSFMMGEVQRRLCGGEGGFFLDVKGGVRAAAFRAALQSAEQSDSPVLLAGTAFSFVHWIELAERNGWEVGLPPGSRIMETGGYKGRSRAVSREALYRDLEVTFGVPQGFIVGEYGMTELLTQFYEAGVGEDRPVTSRHLRGPPWIRSRVLDPLSLGPVPSGSPGVLAHFDLANLGSVAAILTEDLGQEVDGGFQLLGRTPGSEARGCSLAMEDFLSSLDEGR